MTAYLPRNFTATFARTLHAATRLLEYSALKTPEQNLVGVHRALTRVASVTRFRLSVTEFPEAPSAPVFAVLDLPARERDPALVQQEIEGCKGLLLEVIRRAAFDWVLYRTSQRMLHKVLAEQAFHWLFVETVDAPEGKERLANEKDITSFEAICHALDLDPDSVRAHVRKLTSKNVMSVGRPAGYRQDKAPARALTARSEEELPDV